MRFERVLALSPHTDDVELGAGGTVARLVEEGAEVRLIAFSLGDAGHNEPNAAAEVLGIEASPAAGLLPTRRFNDHRQSILEVLTGERKAFNPDLVLCPSSFDFHQDHEVIRAEALRAFRTCTILGYELPWSCRGFDAQCLAGLSNEHLQRKVSAVRCYQSQADKSYTNILYELAVVRGMQGGRTQYAEAFEVIRWVM